ncbi:M56 family metallopeptidase [Paenibacillus piri]|uniref:Peptidase M48 domain-containing protein n=1 Tax=Paenibacillus piri TaxID=2547395 RepID=A0A4R5K683_9BACL|nr:M56 family metallopeptidase [Paenibacillus piri]TDF88141.1 hypothetical protein E1757_35385 [Paenibacillus piri]
MIRLEKTQVVMPLIVFLSGWVLIQMGISLYHQLRDVESSHHLLGYVSSFLFDMWNKHSIFEMLFTCLICFTLYRVLLFVSKHMYAVYKWNVYIHNKLHTKLTKRWNKRLKTWKDPVLVIREPSPIAFATGFLHPKIVISTGLLELLSNEEVMAVLLHEKYHCQCRHPLTKWVVRMIIHSMEYVSVIKRLGNHYDIWIELLADRYAMKQMSSLILGSALLKLIKTNKSNFQTIGVSFADQAINYRLQQIIEPDQPVHVPVLPLSSILSTGAVLFGMLMIVIFECM